MKCLMLVVCALCIGSHLVFSMPVEPMESAIQEQVPLDQQETLITLDLGDPKHEMSARDKRTIGFLRQLFPGLSQSEVIPEDENKLAGAESQVNEVRVQYTGSEDQGYSDQDGAATGGNDGVVEEDDEQRNKRYLNYGEGVEASTESASGGSGGGSGNFIFDIIRLITGSSGAGSSSDSSGGSSGGDASAGADAQVEKDNGYEAGVPGPITRLFIIANRGLANLMQDLILRLAQTSERIVNFKARLITSII